MQNEISAIILAAGLSSRMGRFKPLLRLGTATVLERAVDLFLRAGVEDIHVVLGHRAGELTPLLHERRVRAVLNPGYREGMFSSVVAGVASLSPGARAFFVHPVDIPLVSPATIGALCQAHGRSGRGIVYPTFQGRRGHPPLIAAGLAGELCAWPGEGGLKAFLRQHEEQALDLPVDDGFILRDMDYPADFNGLAEACRDGRGSRDDPAAMPGRKNSRPA